MAKRTEKPNATPPAPSQQGEKVASGGSLGRPILTADERMSPLFLSLRDIDRIEDPELRLAAALDRLDAISRMALGRERTVGKDQHVILDPDCNAAVKVEEVAHRLLNVEPRRIKARAPDLSAFNEPLKAVK